MPRPRGVSNLVRSARAGDRTPVPAGWRARARGPSAPPGPTADVRDTPREYRRIALRRPSGRCYPLRALGAGDVRGSPPKPDQDPRERDRPVPPNGTFKTRADPWPPIPVRGQRYPSSDRPHRRVHIDEWTRSRSGEPLWESCRSRSRRPTSRRGCATPSWSTSMSSASGSPSRTASRRTGWSPATAR